MQSTLVFSDITLQNSRQEMTSHYVLLPVIIDRLGGETYKSGVQIYKSFLHFEIESQQGYKVINLRSILHGD